MSLPSSLSRLKLPLIGAPLFIIAQPELVIAQCKAGIVGAFPALNARPPELLDTWLTLIKVELEREKKLHPDQVIWRLVRSLPPRSTPTAGHA